MSKQPAKRRAVSKVRKPLQQDTGPVSALQARQTFSLIVVAPLPPRELSRNASGMGRHWAKRARFTKDYRRDVGLASIDARNRAGMSAPFAIASVTLRYFFPKIGFRGKRDEDNLIAWAKAGLDALQDAKIVKNDRCLKMQRPQQELSDDPRLEIHLEGELFAPHEAT